MLRSSKTCFSTGSTSSMVALVSHLSDLSPEATRGRTSITAISWLPRSSIRRGRHRWQEHPRRPDSLSSPAHGPGGKITLSRPAEAGRWTSSKDLGRDDGRRSGRPLCRGRARKMVRAPCHDYSRRSRSKGSSPGEKSVPDEKEGLLRLARLKRKASGKLTRRKIEEH